MNIPKTIETAIADAIRANGNAGADTMLRLFHNLRYDSRWRYDDTICSDVVYPIIDIRCAPALVNSENQHTLTAKCEIVCATESSVDRDHERINALELAVQETVDALFAGWTNSTGAEWTAFKTAFDESASGAHVAGMEIGESMPPEDGDGINKTGVSVIVHFVRDDY